jgi:hypothetical protein
VVHNKLVLAIMEGFVGYLFPPQRYGILVIVNNAGSAFHTSDTNMQFVFTPLEGTSEAN